MAVDLHIEPSIAGGEQADGPPGMRCTLTLSSRGRFVATSSEASWRDWLRGWWRATLPGIVRDYSTLEAHLFSRGSVETDLWGCPASCCEEPVLKLTSGGMRVPDDVLLRWWRDAALGSRGCAKLVGCAADAMHF